MDAIRQTHDKTNPFTDPDFPFDHDSNQYFWVRPHEITSSKKEPVFISGGASTLDINQGALGDCWFLAAVQVFMRNEKMAKNLLCPSQNSFKDGEYCGAFVFKFWRYGEYIDVIIDDKLPCIRTRNGNYRLKNIKVGKSGDETEEELDDVEYWPCLVEKAYAKLKGGYESIEGGLTNEAFTDLCGATGRTEALEQDCNTIELFLRIETHIKSGGFVTCSADGNDTNTSSYGIVGGHAYSVNRTVRAFRGSALLLSIRNPWGKTEAKNLPYSDDSDIWNQYPNEKARLQKKLVDDGEFFMEIGNFVKFFSRMTVSFMEADTLCEENTKNLMKSGNGKCVVWNELHSSHPVLPEGSGWGNRNDLPRVTFSLQKKSKCIVSFCIKNRRKDNITGVHTGFCVFNQKTGERVFSMSRYEGKTAYENMRIMELDAGDYEIEPKSLRKLEKDFDGFARVWCLGELEMVNVDEPRASFSGAGKDQDLEDKKADLQEICDELMDKFEEFKVKLEEM